MCLFILKLFGNVEGDITVAGNLQDQVTIPCGDPVTLTFDVTDGCSSLQDTLVISVDKGIRHLLLSMVAMSSGGYTVTFTVLFITLRPVNCENIRP